MRVIGPRKRFILIERIEGGVSAEGEAITWTETEEFGGVFNSLRGREGISYDKTGIIADHRIHTEYSNITEKDRIKLKGTDRIFDVSYVDDKLLKNKILVVDVLERKK
jgi:SPP1 family predicted phage head-tail adaptor